MPPLALVLAGKDQHLAPVLEGAGAQHHVVGAVLQPDLGVPHMAGEACGILCGVQQAFLGVDGDAVAAGGQAEIVFPAGGDVVVVAGQLDVAGVEQPEHPVLVQGRAGISAVAVEGLVGVEGHGLALPVEQVGAGDVSPVLDPAGGVKGAVLVEHVVGVAHLAQAVGVVEPAHRRLDVQPLAVRVGGCLGRPEPLHQGDQVLQIAVQCIHTAVSSGSQIGRAAFGFC